MTELIRTYHEGSLSKTDLYQVCWHLMAAST